MSRLLVDDPCRAAWRLPIALRDLSGVFAAMQCATGLEGFEVELTIADDALIAMINEEQLGCIGPTNILSFPAYGAPPDYPADGMECGTGQDAHTSLPLLGSLVLSVDTLRREAFLYGQPVQEHCLRLLAHGLGHIAGYDHGAEMEAFEKAAREAALATRTAR